jgi:hypothetical protein
VLLYISPCFLDAYTEIYTVLPWRIVSARK